mgnify:CR=1 FL=1
MKGLLSGFKIAENTRGSDGSQGRNKVPVGVKLPAHPASGGMGDVPVSSSLLDFDFDLSLLCLF